MPTGSGLVIPVLLARESASAWVPELEPGSVPVWAQESESVPVWEQGSDSVPESDLVLASVMPMASQALESASDSEMPVLLARESASVWVPVPESDSELALASVMQMASQALESAWVPESVWARESASELVEDRNQRHLQPLSLPLLRLLPRIYPGK